LEFISPETKNKWKMSEVFPLEVPEGTVKGYDLVTDIKPQQDIHVLLEQGQPNLRGYSM
jgi:hypothetical protein